MSANKIEEAVNACSCKDAILETHQVPISTPSNLEARNGADLEVFVRQCINRPYWRQEHLSISWIPPCLSHSLLSSYSGFSCLSFSLSFIAASILHVERVRPFL